MPSMRIPSREIYGSCTRIGFNCDGSFPLAALHALPYLDLGKNYL